MAAAEVTAAIEAILASAPGESLSTGPTGTLSSRGLQDCPGPGALLPVRPNDHAARATLSVDKDGRQWSRLGRPVFLRQCREGHGNR